MAGIMISTTVEIFQYFIGRSSDIDDIILNTVGVCIGFLIYKCLVCCIRWKKQGDTEIEAAK